MFQGITNQIIEAHKEFKKQEILNEYVEMMEKFRKQELRKKRKAETALRNNAPSAYNSELLKSSPGLKSFFYTVFENQKNEHKKERINTIENFLIRKGVEVSATFYKNEYERIKPNLKNKKEVKSLQKLVERIKTATHEKYYYHEVSTMIQFIDRSAEINSLKDELERVIHMGEDALQYIQQIIRTLKKEESWGSWDLFFSQKGDPEKIKASAIDEAFELIPKADTKLKSFGVLSSPFLSNRNMLLNIKSFEDFMPSMISNMIQDWLYESKIKTTISRANQVQNSLNMVLHNLKTFQTHNKNEIALMEVERQGRIKRTEAFVTEKLNEKI